MKAKGADYSALYFTKTGGNNRRNDNIISRQSQYVITLA